MPSITSSINSELNFRVNVYDPIGVYLLIIIIKIKSIYQCIGNSNITVYITLITRADLCSYFKPKQRKLD